MPPKFQQFEPRVRSKTRRTAFTLAELVVVVLILSIMAVVAVPKYLDLLTRFQADYAARRVQVDLEYARHAARKAGASRTVVFDVSNNSYTIQNVTDVDRAGRSDYVVKLALPPYRSKLVSASCGGDATLVFNGYGRPDSTAVIQLTSGSITKTLTVETSAGKVTIQ